MEIYHDQHEMFLSVCRNRGLLRVIFFAEDEYDDTGRALRPLKFCLSDGGQSPGRYRFRDCQSGKIIELTANQIIDMDEEVPGSSGFLREHYASE